MLVSLAEEGWTSGHISNSIVRQYLAEAEDNTFKADSIILGCTHFPLLRDTISSIAGDVVVVDSATTTAAVVRETLMSHGGLIVSKQPGMLKLLATDGIQRFARVGGQFLGQPLTVENIQLVDL